MKSNEESIGARIARANRELEEREAREKIDRSMKKDNSILKFPKHRDYSGEKKSVRMSDNNSFAPDDYNAPTIQEVKKHKSPLRFRKHNHDKCKLPSILGP